MSCRIALYWCCKRPVSVQWRHVWLQISLLICVAGRGSCVGCRDCCGRLQTNGVVTALTRSDDQSAVARSWFSSVLMSTSFLLCWLWSFVDGYCGYTTTVFNADFVAWASPGVPWFRLVLLTVAVRRPTPCLLDGIGICCLFDVTGILGSGPIRFHKLTCAHKSLCLADVSQLNLLHWTKKYF